VIEPLGGNPLPRTGGAPVRAAHTMLLPFRRCQAAGERALSGSSSVIREQAASAASGANTIRTRTLLCGRGDHSGSYGHSRSIAVRGSWRGTDRPYHLDRDVGRAAARRAGRVRPSGPTSDAHRRGDGPQGLITLISASPPGISLLRLQRNCWIDSDRAKGRHRHCRKRDGGQQRRDGSKCDDIRFRHLEQQR
jgi:hypothetical protein